MSESCLGDHSPSNITSTTTQKCRFVQFSSFILVMSTCGFTGSYNKQYVSAAEWTGKECKIQQQLGHGSVEVLYRSSLCKPSFEYCIPCSIDSPACHVTSNVSTAVFYCTHCSCDVEALPATTHDSSHALTAEGAAKAAQYKAYADRHTDRHMHV